MLTWKKASLYGVAAAIGAAQSYAADDMVRVEEIVVTAQKRPQSLQAVPVSAQVITGDEQRRMNRNTLNDLAQAVPTLHLSTQGTASDMYIRGIGSGQNGGFDQSVGTFVDDIYHGSSKVTQSLLLDTERVEVLKGPQSTFFGNSAIAGALNIITRKPGNEFDAWTRALYGMHGQYALEGAAGGPVNDVFGVRGAVTINGTDGFIENVTTGENIGNARNLGGRVSLRFHPNEALDVVLKVEGSSGRSNANNGQGNQLEGCPAAPVFGPLNPVCATALAVNAPIGFDQDKTAILPGEYTRLNSGESVLTVNYQKWDHTFTSVSGYTGYDFRMNSASLVLPVYLVTSHYTDRNRQFSQELRVTSPTDRRFEYLGGLYFQRTAQRQTINPHVPVFNSFLPPAFAPFLPLGSYTDFRQTEHQYSAFGSVSMNVTDQLKLTAGLRQARVEKDFTQDFSIGAAGTRTYGGDLIALPTDPFSCGVPFGCQGMASLLLGAPAVDSASRSDSDWTPSAKIQYQMTPDAMVYASYAQGFKAGGFNAFGSNTGLGLAFGPEQVKAYELGLKSEWFDNKLLVNLDLFRSNYDDLQVGVFFTGAGCAAGCLLVRNAATSRSQGVELQTQVVPNLHFKFGANVAYLEAQYVRYADAPATALQSVSGFPTQDLSGRPTPFAPTWSGNVSATYTARLPRGLVLSMTMMPFFTSSYYLEGTIDPLFKQPGFVRLDAQISLESADGRWAFDLVGKNLTDRTIKNFQYSFGALAPGMSFGAKAETWNVAGQVRYYW